VNVNGVVFTTSTAVESVHVITTTTITARDGGKRADGFGANYRDGCRADRSGAAKAMIRC